MKNVCMLITFASLPGLASCGDPDRTQPVPRQPAAAEIVTLRFRDGLVEVVKGPDGIRYHVLGNDGAALARGLTRAELAARFPRQSEAVEAGVASPPGAVLDASLYEIPQARPSRFGVGPAAGTPTPLDASSRQPPAASRQSLPEH